MLFQVEAIFMKLVPLLVSSKKSAQDPHTGQPLSGPPGSDLRADQICASNDLIDVRQATGCRAWMAIPWEGHLGKIEIGSDLAGATAGTGLWRHANSFAMLRLPYFCGTTLIPQDSCVASQALHIDGCFRS